MGDKKLDTYIAEGNLPYAFCPGCSHGKILEALSNSLKQQGLGPSEVVIVTDIGCVGLSDKYFVTPFIIEKHKIAKTRKKIPNLFLKINKLINLN